MPFVQGQRTTLLETKEGVPQFKRSVLKSTTWEWAHQDSGFQVKVIDYVDGRVHCEINDAGGTLAPAERRDFDILIDDWISTNLPVLRKTAPDPIASFENLETWADVRYGENDLRRWGVLLLRLTAEFGHTTTLILAYIREGHYS